MERPERTVLGFVTRRPDLLRARRDEAHDGLVALSTVITGTPGSAPMGELDLGFEQSAWPCL